MSLEDDLKRNADQQKDLVGQIEAPFSLQADLDDIARQRAELFKMISQLDMQERDLTNKRRAEEDSKRSARVELGRVKKEFDSIVRSIKLEREASVKFEKQKELIYEIDQRTANEPWRQYAFPHQIEGAHFITQAKRVICADAMGTGKTMQSIISLSMLQAKRVLVITPGDVMSNFKDEMKRWAPERPCFVIGKIPKAQQFAILDLVKDMEQFVVVINYEAWARNFFLLEYFIDTRFDTLIIDEAHIIKETTTAAYRGIERILTAGNICEQCGHPSRKICPSCDSSYTKSSIENFIAMTGTLILNRPTEAYAVLHLINSELFPAKYAFEQDFCMRTHDNKVVFRPGGEAGLAGRIRAFYIRRTKEDAGVILPPQTITRHIFEIPEDEYLKQQDILEQLMKHAALEIEEGRATTQMDILALITRQRQAATWPGAIRIKDWKFDENGFAVDELGLPVEEEYRGDHHFEWLNIGENYRESIKMDKAVELIEELNESGNRVVVFSQFTSALEELGSRLGERSALFTGQTNQETRDRIKRNFNRALGEDPIWDNILCNYKTGGVGLNLTAATAIIILDEEWNPGKNSQAYDRINRIGQTEETQVHIFELASSFDEQLRFLIEQKAEVVSGFNTEAKSVDMLDEMKKLFAR